MRLYPAPHWIRRLNVEKVALFFSDQIEANKLVQYALMARWLRTETPPAPNPVSLTEVLRPQLDKLRIQLIEALAQTIFLRQQKNCKANLAKAIAHYAHQQGLDALYAIALDRALVNACYGIAESG